jgi:hypothetical protein
VQSFSFLGCKELLVRAWDSSQNGQPSLITWNLMGMMNNCYHRWGCLPAGPGRAAWAQLPASRARACCLGAAACQLALPCG